MTNWYVRKGGSDSNSGTTASLTPVRSGTDGITAGASASFDSATAAFTPGDVGKGINISGAIHRIASYTSAVTVQLDRNFAAGSGSGRSWAIGGALLTINKLTSPVASNSTLAAGDNIYIGAGVYRELVTLGASFAGSQVHLIGDVDGSHTGDPGEVQITGYLTDNKTVPTTLSLITATAKSFWSFENLYFVTGTNTVRLAVFGDATDITFRNCAVLGTNPSAASAYLISHIFTTAGPHNILYDSCRLLSFANLFTFTFPTHASADYDAGVVIKNCVLDAMATTCLISASGALSFKGGGLLLLNTTIRAGSAPVNLGSANLSTAIPVKVENCWLLGTGALTATTLGQIVEDYNVLSVSAAAARSNVNAGAHSVSDWSRAPLVSFGQEAIWGGQLRPYLSPSLDSGLLGFGSSGNGPTVDVLGIPRPSGGQSPLYTAGAYERGNCWLAETTTTHTGNSPVSVTGPGYHDFYVPVTSGVAVTLSMQMRYDSTYAGTRPQLAIRNSTAIGVADQTVTVSVAALNAWEQQAVTFTPTATGVVTVRLISNDTNGAGKAFADTFGYA